MPGASRAGIVGLHGDRLRLRVRAPAVSGQANEAVLALLAEALAVPAGALRLVRGVATPFKTVEIRGLTAEVVGRLLYGGAG